MRLIDFTSADLTLLCVTLKTAMDKALDNVQFLQENYPTSDLLPHYEEQFDRLQRLYTQAFEASVTVKRIENIASN